MRFDHFDFLAPLYDRVIRLPEDTRLAEMVGLPIAGRLLDAGGGTGRIAQRFVDQAGLVVVADTSVKMLRQASSKEHLCCMVGGATERLPFPEASFERVIVVDAFHHLADQERSLGEFWRVLMPGGRLVIEEPDIRHFGVKLVALAEKLTLMRSHFVPAEEIAALLSNLGASTTIHREGYNVWAVGHKATAHSDR
jgi:ubiquinone/menaquinone biosynthesis C-methylase UbiE